MIFLQRLYGPPHELLHVLALLLIGRKPEKFTTQHVDIPNDLTKRQYIFVAALPTVVFALFWAIGVIALLNSTDLLQIILALMVALFGGFGVQGGMGDIQLILLRLSERDDDR